MMESIQRFIDRNKDTYQKYGDVSEATINKYVELFDGSFPEEIIWVWRNMGYGVFEDGYLQIVDPEEYAFALDYIDTLFKPVMIWGITALGDLLIWERTDWGPNSPFEIGSADLISIRKARETTVGHRIDVYLNMRVCSKFYLLLLYHAKPYFDIKGKLPKLEYGQCYGYVPALALGGSASIKNLQVLDAKIHIDIIGQSLGKIIDFGD